MQTCTCVRTERSHAVELKPSVHTQIIILTCKASHTECMTDPMFNDQSQSGMQQHTALTGSYMRIKVMAVSPGGGPLVFQAGYHPRKRTFKTHPYFSGMKIDPKYAFLNAFFSIFHHVLFKICQYDQKHTLFSNFVRFCTPKRCTPVHWLVLKNNPSNNVNFLRGWYPTMSNPGGGGGLP